MTGTGAALTPDAEARRTLAGRAEARSRAIWAAATEESLWLFVLLRVGFSVFALAVWAHTQLPGPCHFELARDGWQQIPALADQGSAFPLVGVWQRWDGCWYTKIATFGYTAGDNSVNFFPLFPLLMSAVGNLLGGQMALAGMLVNAVAYIAAMVALFRLVALDFGPAVARRSVLYISIFPTAFFFLAPFTEATFLAAAAWALLAARENRWVLAALAALLASLARIQGILLVLPLGWLALTAWWRAREADPARPLVPRIPERLFSAVAIGAPVVGFVGFMALGLVVDGRSFLDTQAAWGGKDFHAPWQVISAAVDWSFAHSDVVEAVNVVTLVLFGAVALVSVRLVPVAWSLYALPQIALLAIRLQPTPLTSTARYLLVVFPVFVVLAILGRRRRFHQGWILASVMFLALLTLFFLNGEYVA